MEFEGKELFAEEGILVPRGRVATSAAEAVAVADEIGYPTVVKAQVLSGGRGKKGGIKFASTAEEVQELAVTLLASKLAGEGIARILVEEKVSLEREFYLAITNDARSGLPILMASAEGGVEIENVPEGKIVILPIDIFLGLRAYQIRAAVKPWGLSQEQVTQVIDMGEKLYQIYCKYDADLAEINPVGLNDEGKLLALDAKVIIEDNSSFRQQRFSITRDRYENELEYRAAQNNLNYVKLNGNIGIICTGAGLTLATLDMIAMSGGRPANFLESGGANYNNAFRGLQMVLSDSDVEVLLINTFGLVSRSDVICRGLADVLQQLKPSIPIVACIRGTGEEEARRIFREELGIVSFESMEAAVTEAIRLAR
jgi:succinyl-CoA synthetase beta subunit